MEKLHVKLHGKVYDLTNFNHPGGKKFIEYASQSIDATPLYESHHFESAKITNEILKKYEIKGETSQQIFSAKSWTEGFYPECKAEVYKWLKEHPDVIERERTKYRIGMYILLVIYYIALSYLLFGSHTFFSPMNFFLCFLVGIIKPILIGVAHNFLHKDRFQSFLFGLGYMSLKEWEMEHVFLHHPYTNTKYDVDFQNIQKIYDIPRPFRMLAIWLKMIPYNAVNRCLTGFTLKRGEYFLNWLIPFVECTLFICYGKIPSFFLMVTFSLNYFLLINFSNHYIKPTHYSDEPVENWAEQQIISSEDFYIADYSFIDSILSIGLCFQVPHHLFPKVDHVLLPHLNPIIEKCAKKHNLSLIKPNFLFANIPSILAMIHGEPANNSSKKSN